MFGLAVSQFASGSWFVHSLYSTYLNKQSAAATVSKPITLNQFLYCLFVKDFHTCSFWIRESRTLIEYSLKLQTMQVHGPKDADLQR